MMDELNGEINGTVRSLWPYLQTGSAYSEGIEKITNEGVKRTLGHKGYFENSSGKDRFKIIMNSIARAQEMVGGIKPVAVSKHLGGEHNEMAALIIFSREKTFSQPLLRQRLIEEFPDVPQEKLPQVFVVDGFRVVDLAEAMTKGRPNETEALPVALHAGFDYQLATEAALTDGTLPTILITEGERLAA